MNVLITGGSKGLGSAVVKKLAENSGDHVYFTYSNSLAAAEKIATDYINTSAIHCDFANMNSVEAFISTMERLDITVLINNAFPGGVKVGYFHKNDPYEYQRSFEVNILPVIKITQAAIGLFRKKKFGKIINVISTSALNKPPIGWSDYAATKNYILSLSKSWATENIRFNITSNCVSPAFMKTDFTKETDPRVIEQMIEAHPLKKLLDVGEVADVILFLSKCSQQINGINLPINSGENIS